MRVASRDLFAVLVSGAVSILSGLLIARAGYGFFPLWVFACILCPLIAALIAIKRTYTISLGAAFAMHASILTRVGWAFFVDHEFTSWRGFIGIFMLGCCAAAVASLGIALLVEQYRQTTKKRSSQQPPHR